MSNDFGFYLNNQLYISEKLSFQEFKNSSFYTNQVERRFFWIKGSYKINQLLNEFIIGLWFENGLLRQVQVYCDDQDITDEKTRDDRHNQIFNNMKALNLVDSKNSEVCKDTRDEYSLIIINYNT